MGKIYPLPKKALMEIEVDDNHNGCEDCYFDDRYCLKPKEYECAGSNRKDGKNVIFKMTDWQEPPMNHIFEEIAAERQRRQV